MAELVQTYRAAITAVVSVVLQEKIVKTVGNLLCLLSVIIFLSQTTLNHREIEAIGVIASIFTIYKIFIFFLVLFNGWKR